MLGGEGANCSANKIAARSLAPAGFPVRKTQCFRVEGHVDSSFCSHGVTHGSVSLRNVRRYLGEWISLSQHAPPFEPQLVFEQQANRFGIDAVLFLEDARRECLGGAG